MALDHLDPRLSSDAAMLRLKSSAAPGTTNWPSENNFGSVIFLKSETTQNVPSPTSDKPRPYVCAICHRCFKRLEHLKRHERLHTKEKPFECPECARCFARRDLLLRHQQKLHWTSTPSSRARNLRESVTSVASVRCSARKSTVASTAKGANLGSASVPSMANIVAPVDVCTMQTIESANSSVAQGMAAESCHPSPLDVPFTPSPVVPGSGMSAVLEQAGMQDSLQRLDSMRTLPMLPAFDLAFEFEGIFFTPTSTINPGSLQYQDSLQFTVMDQWSPFGNGIDDVARDMPVAACFDGLEFADFAARKATN